MRSNFVHFLIGVCVSVTCWFALKDNLNAFRLHILLCVTGYQLVMSYGMLCLNGYGWLSSLSFKSRRRMHWLLQTLGSIFAITGSWIMIQQKSVNFTSIHGKLALAALILTCCTIFNGVLTQYNAFHRFIKYNHLLCGGSTFLISSICLCFGFIKESFKLWSSELLAYFMIISVLIYTVIIVWKPYSLLVKFIINEMKRIV